MKVFLSWSGETSKKIAEQFKEWLPLVIQQVEPYMSSEMEKGVRWSEDIHKELQDSAFGLIFLTPDNIEKPWISYEAGALANKLDSTNVSPFYFSISPSDIQNSPLTLFQATKNDKSDILKLIKSLNRKLPAEKQMDDTRLTKTFEQWWPSLEKNLQKSVTPHSPIIKEINFDPMEEVVENTRSILREIHNLRTKQASPQLSLGQMLTGATKSIDDLKQAEIRYRKGYLHGAIYVVMHLKGIVANNLWQKLYDWASKDLDEWLWRAARGDKIEIEHPPEINF